MPDPTPENRSETGQESFSPLGFVSGLREGQVTKLENIIINTRQLTADFEWGSQKLVYDLKDKFLAEDAVLKMYRDPTTEDQPLRSDPEEEIQITIYPSKRQISEPPIGTLELSNFKRDQYARAREYFGDQVPNTSFFLACDQNSTLRNWEIQTRIFGQVVKDWGWTLKYCEEGPKSMLSIVESAERMLNETGTIPDFGSDVLSNFNIVTDTNGRCFLVDTDAPLEIDPQVISEIKDRNEKVVEKGVLHPLVIEWIKTSTSIEASRCQNTLQETAKSLERAKKYFAEPKTSGE